MNLGSGYEMEIHSGHLQTKSADMVFAFYETHGSWYPWWYTVHNRDGLYNCPRKSLHNSLICLMPKYCPFHSGANQAHRGNLLAFKTIGRTSQKICPWEIKLSPYTQERLKYSFKFSDSDFVSYPSTGEAHTDRGSILPSLSLNWTYSYSFLDFHIDL